MDKESITNLMTLPVEAFAVFVTLATVFVFFALLVNLLNTVCNEEYSQKKNNDAVVYSVCLILLTTVLTYATVKTGLWTAEIDLHKMALYYGYNIV